MAASRNAVDFIVGVICLANYTLGSILEIGVVCQSSSWTQLLTNSSSGHSGRIHWINQGNNSVFDTATKISNLWNEMDVLVMPNPMKHPPIDAIKVESHCTGSCYPTLAVFSKFQSSDALHQALQTNHLLYISHMIKGLSWPFVVILTDIDNGDEAHLLTMELSVHGVKSNTVLMANENNMDFLRQMIHTSGMLHVKPLLRFVVMCTHVRTLQILKEAEEFDKRVGKRALLRHFSRWLLALSPGYQKSIEDLGLNLDHVATVIKPSDEIDTSHLTKFLLKITLDTLSEKLLNRTQATEVFLELVDAEVTLLNTTAYTLLWKTTGRRFSKVQLTTFDDCSSRIFPNVQLGFNNRLLIGAILEWKPFSKRHEENGTVYYTHAAIDMFDFIADVLNFTYILKEPADSEWGRPDPNNPEKYTGLLGMLQNEEADIVPCPLGITIERETVADFATPLYHAYNGIILRKSQTSRRISSALTDPFKWEVYAIGGVILIAVTALYIILERSNPFYQFDGSKKKQYQPTGPVDSVMCFFGAAIHQGSIHLPHSWTGRTLVSFWWLYSIIMTSAYSGNLIASLTVNKEEVPYTTIQEVTSSEDVKLGVWGGSVIHRTIETANDSLLRSLRTKLAQSEARDPDVLSVRPSEHISKLASENYGYLSDTAELKSFEATMCDVYILDEVFLPQGYSYALSEGSPLTEVFSQEILKVQEVGLLNFWIRKWSPLKNHSGCPSAKLGAQPIELEKLAAVALALLAGVLCSIVSLLTELALRSDRLLPKWVKCF